MTCWRSFCGPTQSLDGQVIHVTNHDTALIRGAFDDASLASLMVVRSETHHGKGELICKLNDTIHTDALIKYVPGSGGSSGSANGIPMKLF
eukprot:4773143-Pyramimonas_sp.AAC.1